MLKFLQGKASDRKLRLFAVGCCRRVWQYLDRCDLRNGLLVVEQYADTMVGEGRLEAICETAWSGYDTAVGSYAEKAAAAAVARAAATGDDFMPCGVSDWVVSVMNTVGSETDWRLGRDADWERHRNAEQRDQCNLVREVFGNPFRPIKLDPSCFTSTVKQLAEAIYDDRAFDRLPILADALEDAGCTNQDILDHCRQKREHVRGCWVVDLVTGKE